MSQRTDTAPSTLSWAARVVFAVLAAAALVLGYLGFDGLLRTSTEYGRSVFDIAYYDLQLFVLGAPPIEHGGPLPMSLEVARFLAPAVTVSVILLALQDLVRRRVRQARIRLLRKHTIVCGPTDVVAEVAAQVREDLARGAVVCVSVAPVPTRVEVLAVAGDPRDIQVLARAGLARAKEIFILGPDSAANAQIAVGVQQYLGPRGRARVDCYAEARVRAVFAAVVAELARPEDPTVFRIGLLNRHEQAAGELRAAHAPSPQAAATNGVTVIGFVGLGEAVVEALASVWINLEAATRPSAASDRPRLVVLDPQLPAGALSRAYAHRQDQVAVHSRLLNGLWLADVDDLRVPGAGRDAGTIPCRVFVCLADDAECLTVAERVLELLQDHHVTVVATLQESRDIARAEAPRVRGRARLVLVNQHQVVFSLRVMRKYEALAKAIHESYVEAQLAKNPDLQRVEGFAPWEDLKPTYAEASRAQAWDVDRKLARVGRAAVSITDVPGLTASAGDDLTDAEVETLAEMEHDRWVEERKAAGWTHGTPRDNAARRHPDIVPWDELDERSKDKDRDAVRAIPRLLRSTGLTVVRIKP